MFKRIIALLVILSVFLVACSSAVTETPGEPSAEIVETPPVTEASSTENPAPPQASATPGEQQATEQADATCTVVSRAPTPGPTEQSLVPPLSDEDWVHGPDDAAVTIIEYGDFQ